MAAVLPFRIDFVKVLLIQAAFYGATFFRDIYTAKQQGRWSAPGADYDFRGN
jgi:hypothetical protein